MKPRLLNTARLSFPLATALAALLSAPSAQAATFTWTSLATPGDWTVAGNWSASTQFVSDSANELMFYSDTTTNIAVATRVINTNVPTALSMNTLTLNGKGASSGASSSTTTIGTSASTWTIGDGTTSTVNLNATFGATAAAGYNTTVAANLTLNQATTLFTGSGTGGFTFSGSIGEAAAGYGITKSGTSAVTLSGAINFTDGIIVSSGTMTLSNNTNSASSMTVNGGTLVLTGNNNPPSAAMTVNTGGILLIGNNTATQFGPAGVYSGNISTGTGGTLRLWSSSAQTLSGIISGSGAIQKAYGGTLTLSGANTYTGRTSFQPQNTTGFTVNVSSFNSVVGGTASSSLGAPTTVANGTVDIGSGGAQAGVNLTYTGAAALGETTDRVMNIVFNGTSSQTITANNASGLLRFTSAFTASPASSGRLILAGTGAGQIDLGLPQLSSGGLEKQGAGTWTLGGSGNFTGATLINATGGGTLSLTSATALRNSPFNTASVAGGASAGLKIATTTLSLGGLTGTNPLLGRFTTALGGPSSATNNGGYAGLTALTLNTVAGSNSSYSGAIAEGATGMSLIKTGAGTQTLTGVNGYTGTTSINAGTLFLNSPGSLDTSAVTVATGATLAGNGTIAGTVDISAGGRLSPGATAGTIGTLTLSNNTASALTLNGINLFSDLPASGTTADLVAITGDLVLNGTNTVTLSALPAAGVAASTNFDLMTYTNKTGSGSLVFVNGLTTLGSLTLVANATGNAQLQVGAAGLNHSVWKGNTDSVWDTATTNWTRNGTATQAFVAGDFVTFDDTALAGRYTVTGAGSASQVTVNNSTTAYIINANIGGTDTPLIKNGTNSLTLGGTNTYSGGTILNAGTLATSANTQLGTGGGITVNGTATWNMGPGSAVSYARSLTVNDGAVLSFASGNAAKTISGVVSGNGTLNWTVTTDLILSNTGNTFNGPVIVTTGGTNPYGFSVTSLGDETGAGSVSMGGAGGTGYFYWYGGNKTFDDRQFALSGTTGGGVIDSRGSGALTITKDLAITGTGNKTLTLGGSTSGNIFSGNIATSTGSAINIAKSGAGTWRISGNMSNTGGVTINAGGALTLSGTNTYSGQTQFSGVGAQLTLAGSQAASANTTFLMNTNASSASSTIKFLDDTGGTNGGSATFGGTYRLQSNNAPGATNEFFVGNNNTANGGTSSGTTTGSTIVIGTMDWGTVAATTTAVGNINITGANTYRLQINNVVLRNGAGQAGGTANNATFNPTTANLTLGAVTQATGNAVNGVIPTLVLGGTSTDNRVTGIISNASDAGTSLRPVNVTKNNTSTWTLSGNNTYTGTTTVANNGTLILSGDNIGMTGGVTLSAGTSLVPKLHINSATALGTGTLSFGGGAATDVVQIDNSSAGAVTVSTANAITLNRNFTFIGTQDLNLGTGAVDLNTTGTALNRIITTTAKTLTLGGALGNTGAGVTGITKQGAGTLVLSGTGSSYTGNTTVSAGTLAVNGSLGATAVSVNGTSTLAGNGNIGGNVTIGATATHALAVAATAGAQVTRAITGTLTLTSGNILDLTAASPPAAGEYVLATATTAISGTPTTINYNGITGTVTVDTASNPNRLLLTVGGGSPYSNWAATFLPDDVSNPALNFDSDNLTNLQEFAFGTNPTSSTGSLVYVNGGTVTTPGSPVLLAESGTYYAVFGRRQSYIADGLTYNVQFSADLSSPWVTSGATPTVLTTSGAIEAVSVPFPGLIATDSGPQKARFFRVEVLLAP